MIYVNMEIIILEYQTFGEHLNIYLNIKRISLFFMQTNNT